MTAFAMIFPGQGSQSIGMLSEIAKQYSIIQETFVQASDTLGYDLWVLIQQGSEDELNKTWKTQPALLTASVALFRTWQQLTGKLPVVAAGHSLGEYSALVCAGVMDFNDAVKLVETRGKLMQEAVPVGEGAMYAVIGLDDNIIADVCVKAAQGDVVTPVNYNSPGQVVIAGKKTAVERAAVLCKEAGAKRVLPLAVSVPSHCLLMRSAADKLAVELEKITLKHPVFDIINNIDVKVESSTDKIKQALVRQLYGPVQWTKTVQQIADKNIKIVIEVGPGKILNGLVKRIDNTLTAVSCNDPKMMIETLNLIE